MLLVGCQSLKRSHGARRSADVSGVDIFQDYTAVSGRGDWFSLPYNCIPEEPCKVFTRKSRGTVWLHGVCLVVVVAPVLKGTPGLFLFSSIREIIDSSTLQRTLFLSQTSAYPSRLDGIRSICKATTSLPFFVLVRIWIIAKSEPSVTHYYQGRKRKKNESTSGGLRLKLLVPVVQTYGSSGIHRGIASLDLSVRHLLQGCMIWQVGRSRMWRGNGLEENSEQPERLFSRQIWEMWFSIITCYNWNDSTCLLVRLWWRSSKDLSNHRETLSKGAFSPAFRSCLH